MPGVTVEPNSPESSEITSPTQTSDAEISDIGFKSPTSNSSIPQSLNDSPMVGSSILQDVSAEFSPMIASDIQDVSSDVSPANTSTGMKKKNQEGNDSNNRRLSSRVRAKPAFFDASPIVSIGSQSSETPSLELASPSLTTETPVSEKDTEQESEENMSLEEPTEKEDDEEEELVFKKPKTPVASKRRSKEALNVTVKKGKKSAQKKAGAAAENTSLFEIVKDGKSALMSVINDWIEVYNNNKINAMVNLVQFFVDSSGCNAKVTQAMVDEEDTVRAIRHLTENFGEQGEEYPLIITKPDYKKFKTSFCTFILQLINLCQHSIIYDDDMMDILICWIIGLSDSQVRAFRHTSTLAGMKIVTGLVDVALKVGVELDNTQRQLDSENQKAASKRSREKLSRLEKRREEFRTNKSELEDMMKRIFSGIFMHRYRDTQPEIRTTCIAEMGLWMDRYSTYFLDQNYLKYLGWTLYDKVGDVRLGVLKVLEKLYENEDFLENLELFTGRFKNRLIHMTLDLDPIVSVQAIKIASLLYRIDVLEEEDCSQVEQLVFCDQRNIAHAAGEFLTQRINKLCADASPKKISKAQKENYLRQMNMKAILDFFIKTEIHQHCAYIVDSLWDHADILKDWKTMTNLLLDTNSLIDLEDEEETALIDLMCCACKQAATNTPPPGRHQYKKMSQKEKKTLSDDRVSISTHFMENLPTLLEKYKADVPKVRELLTIPQYFDLEVYAEKRLTKHLESLVGHMEDIVLKHADTQLLDTCSETYFYLIDNDLVIRQTSDVSKNSLVDEIAEKLRDSIAHGIPNEDDDKKSLSYYNTVTSLKRFNAFVKYHDLTEWNLYPDINAILDQGVQGSVDEEVLMLSTSIMYMSHLNQYEVLDTENPTKVDMKLLRKHQKTYVKQMDELLQFSTLPVKTEVFRHLCDYFVCFAKQLLNKAPKLAPIVVDPDTSLQVRMRDFVITHIFNTVTEEEDVDDEEDDEKTAELYKKRVLLAGFCKLVAFGIFDTKLAAPIYAQFLRTYGDYSDIIKQLMQKAKESNVLTFSRTLLFALQQAFESLRDDSDGLINTRSDQFSAIKDLAHRFALTLGVNINTDNARKSTITIHRGGISYALKSEGSMLSPSKQQSDVPPNLLFLEILHEFTYRVISVDRKTILRHLEEEAGDLLTNKGVDWAPIKTYKNGLDSGTNETKIIDDAEHELEAELAMEKKGKKRSISFADTTKKLPRTDKQKAKKKLSLSKVGNTDKWLSKNTIEEEKQKSAPKTAKAIPKARRSAENNKTELSKKDSKTAQTSPKKAAKSPKKSIISPIKKVVPSPARGRKAANAAPLLSTKKKTPGKKGAVAKSPVKISSKRKHNESSQLEESSDIDSEINSSLDNSQGDVESIGASSQKSWLATQQRVSAKKPKQSYSNTKSPSLLKRSQVSLDDSSLDSSDISSPRQARAAKRLKKM